MAGRHRREPEHPPGVVTTAVLLVAGVALLLGAAFGIREARGEPEAPKSTAPSSACTP